VGASLVVWLAAGLLGWTGASSFAELGTAIPLNGGPQVCPFEDVYIIPASF
jgi:amino acid transporter